MVATDAYLKCLLLIQTFETHWAYYAHSEAGLYAYECRDLATQILNCLEDLRKQDALIQELLYGKNPDSTRFLLQPLQAWLERQSAPENREDYASVMLTAFKFFRAISQVKNALLGHFNVDFPVPATLDKRTFQNYATFLRWKAILPKWSTPQTIEYAQALLHRDEAPAAVETMLSHEDNSLPPEVPKPPLRAIAVMGDIRKSQDLMTYAESPEAFARNIKEFLDGTRARIGEYHGLFDKFTGDGFLAYFDEGFCDAHGQDYVACFIQFAEAERKFAARLFAKWEQQVRKLPAEQIGLAIGADIGRVAYKMEDDHFVVVGDAIVWAARMASEANAGEIVVNNLLYQQLQTRPGLAFNKRIAKTKSGETFRAYTLSSAAQAAQPVRIKRRRLQ